MADISLKFGVQGDKNMKSALAAINSEIKGLDAEMKLAIAQMEGMDDAEAKNAKTSEILQKQYKANADKVDLLSRKYSDSQKKLESLGKELDEAKKLYGENSDEVKKLESAYNKQKKATTDLGTELTKAQTNMQKAKNSMDSLGKEAKETSGELDKGAKSTSTFGDTLKAKLCGEAIIAAVKKLASGLKDLAMGAITLSDDLATQAQVTGLSTDALQEYNYMAELVDVSVDTITGSLTKLTRNMSTASKGSGDAYDAFEKLNVSFKNTDGSLRKNQDVFNDLIDALGKVENETERDSLSMALFGKSAQDLNPLIKAGSATIKAYAQEAHNMGYVMSSDVIAKNVQASDAYERMKNAITGAKNYIGSQFAPAVETAANTVQKLVQAARDNEDVVKKLAAVITAAIAGFVAYKAAVTAASAATALMAANPVTLCIAAITALTVASLALSKQNVELSKNTNDVTKRIDSLTAEINESKSAYQALETQKKNTIATKESEMKYYQDLYKELDRNVDENGKVRKGYEDRAKTITGILSQALGIEISLTGDQIKNYQTLRTEIQNVIAQKKAEAILNAQEAGYTQALQNRTSAQLRMTQAERERKNVEQDLANNVSKINLLEAEYKSIQQQGLKVKTARQFAIEEELESLRAEQKQLQSNAATAETKYKEAQEEVATYTYNIAQYEKNLAAAHEGEYDKINTVTVELIKAYQNATAAEKKELDKQYGNVLAEASRQYNAALKVGTYLVHGMRDGVKDKTAQDAATLEVSTFASKLLATAKQKLQVKSPSKATAEIGRYLMEGFSVGIEDEEGSVLKEVAKASNSILGAFGNATGTVTSVNGLPAIKTGSGTYVIQLALDGKQIATNTTNVQAQRQRAYAL